MTVKTNVGDFHGFDSLEIYMRLEEVKEVDILEVEHMTIKIKLPFKKHTYNDILGILEKGDM